MQTDAAPAEEQEQELLHPGAAATILGVTITTLGRYARSGAVPSRTLPSGHRRYVRSVIEAVRDSTYIAPGADDPAGGADAA